MTLTLLNQESIETEAMAVIAFAAETMSGDLLATARAIVQDKLNQCSAGSQNLRQRHAWLQKEYEAIKTKTGDRNVFHDAIAQQLRDCNAQMRSNYDLDDRLSAVFRLLNDYERTQQPQPPLLGDVVPRTVTGVGGHTRRHF